MKILRGAQMASLDRLSIRRHGISAGRLMERAAEQCLQQWQSVKPWRPKARGLIVSGPGNNGGDGMAMALLLRGRGLRVPVFFLGNPERLSSEAKSFYRRIHDQVIPLTSGFWKRLKRSLQDADFVVDAIFGIGLKRPITGNFAKAIAAMNKSRGFKLAVDIPSGIDADSGQVLGTAFRADLTVTFEAPKWGQISPPAWDYVGELRVVPIGLSQQELKRMKSEAEWLDDSAIRRYFRPRSRGTHKGSAGNVLVVAGSKEMPGAGYLSAWSALRAGAGLVVWALPDEAYQKLNLRYPEVILLPLPASEGKFAPQAGPVLAKKLSQFRALAVGPGLGQGEGLRRFLQTLLKAAKIPRVCDADALNNLAVLRRRLPLKGTILTPHAKEMSRLTGAPVAEILAKPILVAKKFAKRHRCWVLLKGYHSVIAGPRGQIFINSTGGPNLATAGSGDVLTGILAGLLAQGMNAEAATCSAAFLHGRAGDRLAKKQGDRGTVASDLAKMIPEVLKELISS